MIGLGTQDSREEAVDFVADYGTASFTMLWDESYSSWQELAISGQPTVVLYAPDGTELGRWSGGIPEADVLALTATV